METAQRCRRVMAIVEEEVCQSCRNEEKEGGNAGGMPTRPCEVDANFGSVALGAILVLPLSSQDEWRRLQGEDGQE